MNSLSFFKEYFGISYKEKLTVTKVLRLCHDIKNVFFKY